MGVKTADIPMRSDMCALERLRSVRAIEIYNLRNAYNYAETYIYKRGSEPKIKSRKTVEKN